MALMAVNIPALIAGGVMMKKNTKRPLRCDLWGQNVSVADLTLLSFRKSATIPVVCANARKESSPILAQVVDLSQGDEFLSARIAAGEFTVPKTGKSYYSSLRSTLAKYVPFGRSLAMAMATLDRRQRLEKAKMFPEARGDVNKIVGQPFFLPLYPLFLTYGGAFRLTFGPKSFIIISDAAACKHILKDNVKCYSKGILSEILDFVMGNGLIPADGELWRSRRRAILPSLHQKFVAAMLNLFIENTQKLCNKLSYAASRGEDVEMESLFSRMTLDIIGKAVFNYEFDCLSNDTGIVEAIYTLLREAESRSTALLPYWKIPPLAAISPRQQKVRAAGQLVKDTVTKLVDLCKKTLEEDEISFNEEYINARDPSILNFLLAAGDNVSSKQLQDDLMTLLIAGHETSCAVLTWTFFLLAKDPNVTAEVQREVDTVLGDRLPEMEDIKKLEYTTAVINESMRLFPQPPILIRRALEDDMIGQYAIKKGDDIFISTWNLHRSPKIWDKPEEFIPERWRSQSTSVVEMTQQFSYLPFGGGPRKCVGDIFATYETTTILAMLVREFVFEFSPGAPPVTMTTGATIHTEKGLHMRVTRRTKPAPFATAI